MPGFRLHISATLLIAILGVSARAAEPREVVNSIGMKLVRIEPGSFLMGQDGPQSDHKLMKHPEKCDDADWDERPAHRVTISAPFYLGATEVTLGQYRKFDPKHAGERGADDEAVRSVTWHEAQAFCRWLSEQEGRSYRLPTEAEWEFACRAGTQTLFHTGDALPAGFLKWFGEIGFRERYFPESKVPPEYAIIDGQPVLPVGKTPANAWGLYDMHGNVAEWCADWYGPYEAVAATNPLGRAAGDFRVFRGGSHSTFARLLRSANRSGWLPEASSEKIGFRVVLGDPPVGKPLDPPPAPLNAQNVPQILRKIQVPDPSIPFFADPQPFVDIPPDSLGPLYSWHNHSPAIAECPNGDLLAVWYSCVEEPGSELSNVASRLRGGSGKWEPASPFWDGPDVNDHAPKLWWDGDETLYHWARGLTENIVRTSTDNGATWSKARIVQPFGEFGNQPMRTRDGTIVLTHDSRSTSLVYSRNDGKTWAYTGTENRPSDWRVGGRGFRYPGIHAPIVELADGRLMTYSRLNSPSEQKPFNFKTAVSYSADFGKSWMFEESEFPAISSVQRAVLIRLHEGPLLLCSFTDQRANWNDRKGLTFKAADGREFTGYGLFAALSYDDGKTWPIRKLVTPGGKDRSYPSIDRSSCVMSDVMAESGGYLASCQTRDGRVHLISSKLHYVFNEAWVKQLPPGPTK